MATKSSKPKIQELGSKKEFLEARKKDMVKHREQARKFIDKLEGSFMIVGLTFKKGKMEADGSNVYTAVCGSAMDLYELGKHSSESGHRAKIRSLELLSPEEKMLVLMDTVKEIVKEK